MYFISLSVTLLVIIAGVHLLAKIRNENLGILSKLIAWLVLVVAILMLSCQLFKGGKMMRHGGGNWGPHHEMMMDDEGGHNKMFIKKFRHGDMEGECMMGGKCAHMENGKCAMKEGKDCPMECCKDSSAKAHCKGMEKEVNVIIEEKKE